MIPTFHLSPTHTLDQFPIDRPLMDEQMIEIFVARIEGWQLAPAETLLSPAVHHGGFAALHVLMSYFEGLEQYKKGRRSGNRESSTFFWKTFSDVFQDELSTLDERDLEDSIGKNLYHNLRCGLYHDGATRLNIRIHGKYPYAISVINEHLVEINPHLFPEKMRSHLHSYIGDLRRPEDTLLKNFQAMFRLALKGKIPDSMLGGI